MMMDFTSSQRADTMTLAGSTSTKMVTIKKVDAMMNKVFISKFQNEWPKMEFNSRSL